MTHRILIVDDEPSLLQSLDTVLSDQYDTVLARSGEEAVERIRENTPDLVLLDMALPGITGLETLRRIKAFDAGIVVIMITAHERVPDVVAAMKIGAFNYLIKPLDLDELEVTIANGLQTVRLTRQIEHLRLEQSERLNRSLIGESRPVQAVRDLIARIAKSDDTTVLIEGESGTGKELAAMAIHYQSARSAGPLVTINCGAIARDLIEVELFGYERGTFTGGLPKGKKGKFELADGGTLLLDEIAEMPLATQTTLLRVMEERALYPVGGTAKRPVDARIVATTNRALRDAVQAGAFREDLYYRLNVAHIVMPPLRDRGSDILLLARLFLTQYAERFGKAFSGLSEDAEALLLANPWRGNVRELKNAMERVALVEDDAVVTPLHFTFLRPSETVAGTDTHRHVQLLVPPQGNLLENADRLLIEHAIALHQGNRSQAAKFLGIPRQNLLYRLRKYHLTVPETEN
ncbi:MAG: sigma-54-dependent Fis family transcriptional regulator [candidate division Zixibacteria bacterium]|nr:sigma-54-dependent Fis family transcriptional regulator [candidate division Zixibacteria bacterium]